MTCLTTHRLFKRLQQENLLNKITLVDVGIDPVAGLKKRIISVPAIHADNTLIYSGVFSVSEAVKTISEDKLPSLEEFDYKTASEKIMYGFLDSSLTALYIFIYDDFEKLFDLREFVEAVSRHIFYRYRSDDSYNILKKQFLEYIEGVRDFFDTNLLQTIANLLVREYIQSNFDRLLSGEISQEHLDNIYASREFIKQYLLARNAFGRIGLVMGYPELSRKFSERIDQLHRYVNDNWSKLYEKIYKDQLNILKDQDYVKSYIEKAKRDSEFRIYL